MADNKIGVHTLTSCCSKLSDSKFFVCGSDAMEDRGCSSSITELVREMDKNNNEGDLIVADTVEGSLEAM